MPDSTIGSASSRCRATTAYACRLFRRHGEQSAYQYLLRQKMALAADLLTHERLAVGRVAMRLGHSGSPQFTRAFKQVAGISPRVFRLRR